MKVERRDVLTKACLTCLTGAHPWHHVRAPHPDIAPVGYTGVSHLCAKLRLTSRLREPEAAGFQPGREDAALLPGQGHAGWGNVCPWPCLSWEEAPDSLFGLGKCQLCSGGHRRDGGRLKKLVPRGDLLVTQPRTSRLGNVHSCPPAPPKQASSPPICLIAAPALSLAPRGNPGDLGNLSAELGPSAASTPEPSIPACDAFGKFPEHLRGWGGARLAPRSPSPSQESPPSPDQFVLPRSISHRTEHQTRPLTENQDEDRPLGHH